ncbi:MAG: FAD-binding protein [Coriobacteriia bacterium]|nr:FAD-binding protein [Coriobacteriia bacterium]
MKSKSEVSRRDFLKEAAIVGAGLASVGALAACSNVGGVPSTDSIKWDKEVDTVVAGSGGGGWAALAANDKGDRVLLVEKAIVFGGTSAISGGGLFIPENYAQKAQGIEDNRADVLKFLSQVTEGKASEELTTSYLDNGPKFLEWSRDTYGFVWLVAMGGKYYQSYYDLPGYRPSGRPVLIDDVKSFKAITGEDVEPTLPVSIPTWKLVKYLCDKHGVETMLETEAKRLIQDDSGAVIGLVAQTGGAEIKIKAKKVILATGGFDHNYAMRTAFLPVRMYNSMLVKTDTGDGHRMGMEIGASLANMSSYYGIAAYLSKELSATEIQNDQFLLCDFAFYRGKPGAVVVNKLGRRVGNESAAYHVFNRSLEAWNSGTFERQIPAFTIMDATYAKYYPLPGGVKVGDVPSFVTKADTLDELAAKLGIDAAGLTAELAEFNVNAAKGVDPVWQRGQHFFDLSTTATMVDAGLDTSNRTDLKNPCLAPVATPPFYGVAIYPGSLGSSGGLNTNGNAQVIDVNGSVIPGLYAVGCTAASPFGSAYPGGGSCVGPTCVMGWVAGSHKA